VPDLRITKVNGVTNGRSDGGANEIERLRADVEETRHRLGSSLAELERRVSVTAHWRKWAGAHPVALLAIGLGAGYLVGRLGGVRRRPA
jgi:hypothetical protein